MSLTCTHFPDPDITPTVKPGKELLAYEIIDGYDGIIACRSERTQDLKKRLKLAKTPAHCALLEPGTCGTLSAVQPRFH